MLELQRITNEKDRCVVSHHVVDAFARIELQREAARIAPGIGATLLTGHGGETDQRLGLGARLKDCGPCVGAKIFSDLKMTESTAPFGMRLALRDALAIEVCHLLDQIVIIQDDGAISADGK